MVDWLLTHTLSLNCWLPLLCGAGPLPWLVAWWLGPSIRVHRDRVATRPWLRGLAHLACSLALTLVYFPLLTPLGHRPVSTTTPTVSSTILQALAGGTAATNQPLRLMIGVGWLLLLVFLNLWLKEGLRQGGRLREQVDRWRQPAVKRGAHGSAHLCTMRQFNRFRRPDPDGLALYGAFWGKDGLRLDWDQGVMHLSGEDVARGILTLGGPGSGKSQSVILPTIAARMQAGHSLIIADPQGELTAPIRQLAAVTGHLLVIHDPTQASTARFNLIEGLGSVSDARAIADVLVPAIEGNNRFWSDSAAALLAACVLRFATLGDIYAAMRDAGQLADKLGETLDDAARLAGAFTASTRTDGKVAANILATLGTALTGWADTTVRTNTAVCDFDARLLLEQPTVVVLTCPGRMRAVYAPYLGATLRKLMMDLDTCGEAAGGPLPVPVAVILDEFPTLGRLDSLVADVNLVRKRRISILLAAQTKGQFHLIYGRDGTQALFTGLATQIVFGGCDAETADYYAGASGITTVQDDDLPLHGRPLLTADEVVTPLRGNCTIFARYITAGYATQAVFQARLTRFYERLDWRQQLQAAQGLQPLLLERGPDLIKVDAVAATSKDFDAGDALAELVQERYPAVRVTGLRDLMNTLGGPAHEHE